MLGRISAKITRNVHAVMDRAMPTDHEIKQFIVKNEDRIPFKASPEADVSWPEGCDFSFYLRGNTPFYVTVDEQRSLVLVQRNWTDGGEKALLKFSDIVKR